MKSTLVSLAGTFTDAACRLETSETSLISPPVTAGQCALVCVLLVVAMAESLTVDMLAHSPAAFRSRRAQTMRPPSLVVSAPQPSGPVRASTTSRPCGRPSGCLRRHGSAEVFGLDPDMIRVQLGADGEVPGPAAGVQDGVGRQFGCDEDGIVGGRASRQVAGDGAADVVHLVGPPWVGGRYAGWRRLVQLS